MAYNFVTTQQTPILITSGQFVADRLSPVYSAEAKYLAATGLKRTAMWEHEIRRLVDCVSNVMAHAQKPDFVFRRKARVYLNRQGRQFDRLLAAELCASAVVMMDTS
jgi:hypothetical protein